MPPLHDVVAVAHPKQEVLESVLGEHSLLCQRTHELQAQLAAALREQQENRGVANASGWSGGGLASPPGRRVSVSADGGSPESTPVRQLRRELVLAKVGAGRAGAGAASAGTAVFACG